MLHSRFNGETVFILGGGASLTAEIAERVHDRKTIAINSTARLAPWASVLFFHDWSWFRNNRPIVDNWPAIVITASARARKINPRCEMYFVAPPVVQSKALSSGHHAVDVAIWLGFKTIVLLGFDCSFVDGRSNNHDDYANRHGRLYADYFLPAWKEYPDRAAARDVRIVNATPGSVIDVFPMVTLDEVL